MVIITNNIGCFTVTSHAESRGLLRRLVGRIGRVSLARENEAGGSWGQKVHILHVKVIIIIIIRFISDKTSIYVYIKYNKKKKYNTYNTIKAMRST